MKAQDNGIGRLAAGTIVVLAHLAVLWWLTLSQVVRLPEMPSLVVLRLEPPAPPPEPLTPTVTPVVAEPGGSSAGSAPSIVHRPPERAPYPEPLPIAPETPAAHQPLVVGIGAGEETGRGTGQGVSGEGTGTGQGAGTGSGDGGGRPAFDQEAQLLRRPTETDIRRHYPREAWRARQTGQAVVSCVVRSDRRLQDCRVMYETPVGAGFGRAGVELAARYRFRPPMRDDRPVEGHRVTFAIEYVRPQG